MRWEGSRAGEVEGRRDQLASGNFKSISVSYLPINSYYCTFSVGDFYKDWIFSIGIGTGGGGTEARAPLPPIFDSETQISFTMSREN